MGVCCSNEENYILSCCCQKSNSQQIYYASPLFYNTDMFGERDIIWQSKKS